MTATGSTTVITDDEGNVLKEYSDEIGAGETKTYTYNVDEAGIDVSEDGCILTVSCTADTEEYYESNNTAQIRVWDVTVEEPEAISNKKADMVEQTIDALPNPEDITDDDYDDVIAAREQYNNLPEDQKLLVSQDALDKLIAAEEELGITPPEPTSYDINDYEIGLGFDSLTYTGKELRPYVYSYGISQDEDFEVTYENNVNVGTGKAIIRGIGDYTGTMTLTFEILPADIAKQTLKLKSTTYTYTGKAIKAALAANGLKSGVDYSLTYKNNKYVGQASVTVTGKGNYKGSKTLKYTIKPAKGAITKLTPAKTSMKVTIKSQKASKVGGYQIAYRKGSGKWKTVTTTKLIYTVKNLVKGSTYSFKVRAYKKINGKKVYGAYSKVIKKKTKK